jgi:hypothetical protein
MVAGAGTLGAGLFDGLIARSAFAHDRHGHNPSGRVRSAPAGRHDLALPDGFQYRVTCNEGDPMDDGFPTPKPYVRFEPEPKLLAVMAILAIERRAPLSEPRPPEDSFPVRTCAGANRGRAPAAR